MALAGGIAAALVRRERTGEGALVDGSLLSTAMWSMSPGIVSSLLFGPALPLPPPSPRSQPTNPLVGVYRTKDGKFVNLVFLQSDRYWPEFCRGIERPELLHDPRFADAAGRAAHRDEFVATLDDIFAERTLDEWRDVLDRAEGVWAPVQTVAEVGHDRQAVANGYLRDVVAHDGTGFSLVACPVQFDETPPELTAAPELGQHTEEVLLDLGLSWDEITAHKQRGDII
jgi:crotonobetainyl-CoA:carnitine CoA-transferase CaiB-like acyl-CoA transferase